MKVWKERDPATGRYFWSGDETIAGVRYRPKAGSKKEVEEILDAIRVRARQRKYRLPEDRATVRLSELVSERVRDLNLSKKNDKRIKVVLLMFRDHFPGDPAVEDLTPADVLDFKRRRVSDSNLKPNSINRELEAVTAMLRRAGTYFPSLEHWKPPAMPYERVGGRGRERVLTDDEAARLLAALRRPRERGEGPRNLSIRLSVADVVQVALLTGMRLGEIQQLRWEWIDFPGAMLSLPSAVTKTKTPRTIPLGPSLRAIFERRLASRNGLPLVFVDAKGNGRHSRRTLYRCLQTAAKKAGVAYGRDEEGGFTFHDTRHTATTAMLHGGGDVATVAEVLGHSQKTMTLRYAHATLESKRRAVENLERFGEGLDKKSTGVSGRDGNGQGDE